MHYLRDTSAIAATGYIPCWRERSISRARSSIVNQLIDTAEPPPPPCVPRDPHAPLVAGPLFIPFTGKNRVVLFHATNRRGVGTHVRDETQWYERARAVIYNERRARLISPGELAIREERYFGWKIV